MDRRVEQMMIDTSNKTYTYTVPIGGLYSVKAKIHSLVPTGRFEWRVDEGRLWWQFWKPRKVLREVMESVEYVTDHMTAPMKAGDMIRVVEVERV